MRIAIIDIIKEVIPEDQILFGLRTLTSELLGPGDIEESPAGSLSHEVNRRVMIGNKK